MSHSFVAYIDESGDDGLHKFREPGGRGGASTWLTIAACVFRQSNDLQSVQWRDQIATVIAPKEKRELHFVKMNHHQRLAATQILSDKKLRIIGVMANKKAIPLDIYKDKNQLYFYITRYLIERISWICRDMRPRVPEGNGCVKITFSRRGGMSYEAFRAYLEKLKSQETRIHWPVIDIASIDAQDHGKRASLQLADLVASAYSSSLEPDQFGNCEPRYIEQLKPLIYHKDNNYLSYGFKLLPKPEDTRLTQQQIRTIDMFK